MFINLGLGCIYYNEIPKTIKMSGEHHFQLNKRFKCSFLALLPFAYIFLISPILPFHDLNNLVSRTDSTNHNFEIVEKEEISKNSKHYSTLPTSELTHHSNYSKSNQTIELIYFYKFNQLLNNTRSPPF